MKITDKMPNALYFYEGLTEKEIASIAAQKYFDTETGILGTISELPEFVDKQYVSIGMSF